MPLYRIHDLHHDINCFATADQDAAAAVVLAFTACTFDGRSAYGAVQEAEGTPGVPVRVRSCGLRKGTRSVSITVEA